MSGHQWVLVIEDTASHWVELIVREEASAEVCAHALVNDVNTDCLAESSVTRQRGHPGE